MIATASRRCSVVAFLGDLEKVYEIVIFSPYGNGTQLIICNEAEIDNIDFT